MPTIYEVASFVILAQANGAAGGDAGGAGAAPAGNGADAAKAADGGIFGGFGFFMPFIIIAVLFYFMLIRPQQRERSRMMEMLTNLKKNDRVETAGGIFGTVVNVSPDSRYVTLRVDEANNTKLHIVKSSIVRVLSDEDVDVKKDLA